MQAGWTGPVGATSGYPDRPVILPSCLFTLRLTQRYGGAQGRGMEEEGFKRSREGRRQGARSSKIRNAPIGQLENFVRRRFFTNVSTR